MTATLFAVCISTVLPYTLVLGPVTEHGTMAWRTPPHCSAGVLPEVQGPPAPLRYDYSPKSSARVAPAAKPEVAATTPAPKVKKATTKRAKGCKPGRVRDSRGICRRKR